MSKKLVAIAAAAVALMPLSGSPANAAAAAGKITFECVAYLPEFPSPQASGTCGTNTLDAGPPIPSSASGVITGATDDATPQPIVLVAAGTNNFSAEFTYNEPCVLNEPPVSGRADGEATITGLRGAVGTTPVMDGTLVVQFTWVRGGGTAAITITGATLSYGGTITGTTVAGVGEASFAPVLQADNRCPVGGDIKAVVEGSATVGAVS